MQYTADEFKDLTLENATFKPFYMLAKFQSKELLEDLQSGHIYMKNLKYFIDLERSTGEIGQGDKYEGRMARAEKLTITDPNTNKSIVLENVDISDTKSQYMPVFCTTAINICGNLIELEYPNFSSIISVNDQLINDFTSEGVELYALLIDAGEFLNRIKNVLNKLQISIGYGLIRYKDTSIFEYSSEKQEPYFNTLFDKSINFAYQQEFRIALDIQVEDHFEFNIGDIRDISILMPAHYLKEGISISGQIDGLIKM